MRSNRKIPTDPGLVAIIVYEGLSLFEFGCAIEIFGVAKPETCDKWYRVATCSVESGFLRGPWGILAQPEHGIEILSKANTIIIPGWKNIDALVPQELCQALNQANKRGARIMSICTGAFVLAAAGLLDNKKATTHWLHAAELSSRFPRVQVKADVLYVDEGDILTSAGSAAGIDLCLHLIRRDLGPRVANQVARRMVVPAHREGGQAQFIESPVTHPDKSSLSRLLENIRLNLSDEWSIIKMARKANVSTRTFQRHFVRAMGLPAGEWLLMERLQAAKNLLEETNLSTEQISVRVGFSDAATLRNHFRNKLGLSPTSYRKLFSPLNSSKEPSSC